MGGVCPPSTCCNAAVGRSVSSDTVIASAATWQSAEEAEWKQIGQRHLQHVAVACIGAAIEVEVRVLSQVDRTRLRHSCRQQQPQLAPPSQRSELISRSCSALARVTVFSRCKPHFSPRASFGAAVAGIRTDAAAAADDCPVLRVKAAASAMQVVRAVVHLQCAHVS